MLIGYIESTKIWKLWDIAKQRAIRSTNVVFIEQENAMTENPGEMGEKSRQLKALAPQNESTEQAPQVSKSTEKVPQEKAPHESKRKHQQEKAP